MLFIQYPDLLNALLVLSGVLAIVIIMYLILKLVPDHDEADLIRETRDFCYNPDRRISTKKIEEYLPPPVEEVDDLNVTKEINKRVTERLLLDKQSKETILES